MQTYFKTRMRSKGQITVPGKIRDLLNAAEGDDLAFHVTEQGQIVIERLETIPADQAWFWTERWQQMEWEVDEDFQAGRVEQFDNVDDLITWLDQEDDADA